MITEKAVYTILVAFGELKGIRKSRKQKAVNTIIEKMEPIILHFKDNEENKINIDNLIFKVSVEHGKEKYKVWANCLSPVWELEKFVMSL